jgi:hypothetical protein
MWPAQLFYMGRGGGFWGLCGNPPEKQGPFYCGRENRAPPKYVGFLPPPEKNPPTPKKNPAFFSFWRQRGKKKL